MFKDNFSTQARVYSQARPLYPASLYQFITSQCQALNTAWDCATGNGQAAIALTQYFGQIIATDASASQIENAEHNNKVIYKVATAENSGIDSHSVDLVTVATALHWFKLEEFYNEVKRVLIPGGIIAAWGYFDTHISKEVDAVIQNLARVQLKDYWDPNIAIIRDGYRNIPFPFERIEAPSFIIEAERDFNWLIDYINRWSASQKYANEKGHSPADEIKESLHNAWGNAIETKMVNWPLFLLIGKS